MPLVARGRERAVSIFSAVDGTATETVRLRCPVCHAQLRRDGQTWRCENGHAFDVAKEGYVNLLLPQQRGARPPGYDRDMLRSRRRILESGLYAPIADALADLLADASAVLDAGCGEGWYLRALAERASFERWGVDIAKIGVQLAARSDPAGGYAVANVYALPFLSGSFDGVLSVFSPIAWDEFTRVVTPGGKVVVAQPGPDHLSGLKELLYAEPRANPDKDFAAGATAWSRTDRRRVRFDIELHDRQQIVDLFAMTPYWHTASEPARARVLDGDRLSTPIDFLLTVYQHTG